MSVQAVGANQSAVTGAIRTAARATGVNFNYLLATAKVESDLDPNLTMRSSSATGLFQFLDQTWLGTLKQAGPAFGFGNYADAISKTASGRYEVANPALRREIMQLRKDPTANAVMGGAFTQQNMAVLSQRIGRKPNEGELYIGHFFGPYAGAKAINLAASNPTANAAAIFPEPARANRSIFYDKQGNARSVKGVCAELTRRYQEARASAPAQAPAVQTAAIPFRPRIEPPTVPKPTPLVEPAAASLRPPAPIPNVARSMPAGLNDLMFSAAPLPTTLAFAGDKAAPPDAPGAAASPARAESTTNIFRSLFQADTRTEPVSPVVTSLWGAVPPAAAPSPAPAPAATSASPPPATLRGSLLDLFRDLGAGAPKRHDGRV